MNAIPRFEGNEDLLRFQISTLVEQVQESTGVPGVSIAVSTPETTVEIASGVCSTATREPMDTAAHFGGGCMAKLLLSIAALELAQEGRVALSAPISSALNEIDSWEQGQQIALVHLLSHTAGYRTFPLIDRNVRDLDWDTFIGKLTAAKPLFRAGTVFNYEHTGAVLAGRILERVTGDTLTTLLKGLCARMGVTPGASSTPAGGPKRGGQHHYHFSSNAYQPIGKIGAAHAPPEFWHPSFSSMLLSMPDLARIGRMLCGATATALEDPLLPATVRGLLQRSVVHLPPYLSHPGVPAAFPRGFSLGVGQYEDGWQGISAPGFGEIIALRYHPGLQISVAVGINADRPQVIQRLARLAGMFAAVQPLESPPRALSLKLEPGEVCGKYGNGSSTTCDVNVSRDGLSCVFKGESRAPGIAIEIALSDGAPVIQSNFPGAAISFFRTPAPESQLALMWGLTAYRKLP